VAARRDRLRNDLCLLPERRLAVFFECGTASGDMHDSGGLAFETLPLPSFRDKGGAR
jgi:hypothetical protein